MKGGHARGARDEEKRKKAGAERRRYESERGGTAAFVCPI